MKGMKEWLYRAGMGMAGVVLVALVMALVAPKTVHAVVSALVTVANTAADPVLNRDVDNPVRLAFQGFATVSGSRTTFNVPSTTPSGGPVKELVIEEISGTCPTVTNETLFVSPTTNGTTSSYVFQTVPGTDSITSLVPSQEVRLYADASTPIFLDEATTATCSVSISGYLVTP